MNVPLKIKVLLAGKPQVQLAQEMRISEAQLSRIIQGWSRPTSELKSRIAKALGCGVEDIFPSSTSGGNLKEVQLRG